jgi:hypothetical protein
MRTKILNRLLCAGVFATLVFAATAQAGDIIYNCCGNESTPADQRCRYLDTWQGCINDQHCSQGGYELCCENACAKPRND